MVNIELSKNEALVLFELLARINEKNDEALFDDKAEQRVFWKIEASLERELSEPFTDNYQVLLDEARRQVREQ